MFAIIFCSHNSATTNDLRGRRARTRVILYRPARKCVTRRNDRERSELCECELGSSGQNKQKASSARRCSRTRYVRAAERAGERHLLRYALERYAESALLAGARSSSVSEYTGSGSSGTTTRMLCIISCTILVDESTFLETVAPRVTR